MFGNFEESTRKILVNAKKEMQDLNHPYVSSEHLLLSILKQNNEISKKLKEYNLDYKIFKQEVIKTVGKGTKPSQYFLYTPLLKRVIENAILDSKDNNKGIVTTKHLFSSLLEEGEGVAIRIMLSLKIDLDDLYNEFAYKLIHKKNLDSVLEEIGINLNDEVINGNIDPLIEREKEINRMLEILSRRSKNNPLLIGKAGVGKTAIVEGLATAIVKGNVPITLKNKQIINLSMSSLVAGTKYRGEFEERLNKIIEEIEDNDNIILFIDEIHTLVGAGGAEGAIDASNIFKPALARGKIRCIGATTIEEYKKFIEPDSALERRFQKIAIKEPTSQSMKNILMNLKEIYESYHNVVIDENIIDLIINLSNKYIYGRNEPDRSIDILDEVCAKVNIKESKDLKEYKILNKELNKIKKQKQKQIMSNNFKEASILKEEESNLTNKINNLEILLYKRKKQKVTSLDVANVIKDKTNIPVYEILNEKKSVLKSIEKNIKNEIIGQEIAVKKLGDICKRIKLGLNTNCYSLLFCGPSGVGKTKLAKLFGKILSEKNVIKLDMSEYKESHSISKIIGSPPGYIGYNDATILDKIKNNPFSVLILDEIEKANNNIINLFLQILDEGNIKDSKSNVIKFNNVVIIMTSNVGYNDASVGFTNNVKNSNKLTDVFSIPFINRVDNVIYFNHLNNENIEEITNIKLKHLKEKYKNKIKINYNKNIIKEIVNLSNYEKFGARKIEKIIKDKIEPIVIDEIINEKDYIYIKELQKVNLT